MSKKVKILLTVLLVISSLVALGWAIYELVRLIDYFDWIKNYITSKESEIYKDLCIPTIRMYVLEISSCFFVCLLNVTSIILFTIKAETIQLIRNSARHRKMKRLNAKIEKIKNKLEN